MKGLSIKALAVFAASLFLVSLAVGQEQKAPLKNVADMVSHYVRCGALVQPESGKVQRNVLITIRVSASSRCRKIRSLLPALR